MTYPVARRRLYGNCLCNSLSKLSATAEGYISDLLRNRTHERPSWSVSDPAFLVLTKEIVQRSKRVAGKEQRKIILTRSLKMFLEEKI